MKKVSKIFGAVAAIAALASCNKEVPQNPETEVVPEGMVKISVSASQGTKTEMLGDGNIIWSDGDQIGLEYTVAGCGTKVFMLELKEKNGNQAKFEGLIPAEDVTSIGENAYYPFIDENVDSYIDVVPTTQAFVNGTFATNVLPMSGKLTREYAHTDYEVEFKATATVVMTPAVQISANDEFTLSTENFTATMTIPVGTTAASKELIFVMPAAEQKFVLKKKVGEEYVEVFPLPLGSSAPTVVAKRYKLCMSIFEADDMKTFSNLVNGGNTMSGQKVRLANDIDLAGVAYTPVGVSASKFAGTFDGNNKTISNLTINGGSYIGLFGYVGNATIANVKLAAANISGVKRVGALIGQIAGNATVENCSTDGNTTVTGSDSNTGGLVGEIAGNITVNLLDLENNAAVTNTESGTSRAGGIAGQVTSSAVVTFDGCVNNGTVKANNYAGGILSTKQPGKVYFTDCVNNGTIDAPYKNSMIAWTCNGGEISIINCADTKGLEQIGYMSADNYLYKFNLNGKEYFYHTGADAIEFKNITKDNTTITPAQMANIGNFFKFAKTDNPAFADYAEDPYGIFCSAWNVNPSGYDKMKTTLYGEEWNHILAQFNNTPEGAGVTAEDFVVDWTYGILYSVEY